MARKFVVLKDFTDLADNRHVYKAGQFYPREGAKLDDARAADLEFGHNARNERLIVEVMVKDEPKEETNLEDLKNDELKAMLDEKEIEYKAKATKKELIELLGGE